MYRQIIGYIPSNIVPAIISMLMIYCYTRILSPTAFGAFNFVFSAVLVLQTSLFYALPIAVMRFYPTAVVGKRQGSLLKEAYLVFYVMSTTVAVIGVLVTTVTPAVAQYKTLTILALLLLIFRSAVQLNQAVTRSRERMLHFNIIESMHSVLGFSISLAALYFLGDAPEGIIFGLLAAAMICAFTDIRLLAAPLSDPHSRVHLSELMKLVNYAWPLVAVAPTAVILQNSDRFLLGSLAGAEVLGIFAVAYNLVERPTTLFCSLISTATFPLVVKVLENEGHEAARLQAGRNGIALLAISLPTCVGIALTANYIAGSLVGPAFREGVVQLLPIMSVTALVRGLRSHFVDHAFHLSGKPLMMLWTYGPATVLNIALNLYVVPRYGMIGAAWTAMVCQGAALGFGWALGFSLFPIWLPPGQVVRCVLAVLPMGAILLIIPFPADWGGLFASVFLGACAYIITALLLDVGNIRSIVTKFMRSRQKQMCSVLTD